MQSKLVAKSAGQRTFVLILDAGEKRFRRFLSLSSSSKSEPRRLLRLARFPRRQLPSSRAPAEELAERRRWSSRGRAWTSRSSLATRPGSRAGALSHHSIKLLRGCPHVLPDRVPDDSRRSRLTSGDRSTTNAERAADSKSARPKPVGRGAIGVSGGCRIG